MLNCAICDDDKTIVSIVKTVVETELKKNGIGGEIAVYTDSRLFLSDVLEYKPLDLVVIDIEMPYFDGMQIAREIKQRFPECCIIFLTSHLKYAVESYELQIFRYTPKSELHEKLPRYVKDALGMLSLQSESTYIISRNETVERLPYRQILCIKKDGKYSVIYCVDKREIRIRKPLREVITELDEQEFIMIDRGCIANIALICSVGNNEVVCKNGERLSVSRSKVKETKSRIAQYWGEKV